MMELLRQNPVFLLLLAVNALSFVLMGVDKLFAISHARRISEKTLLLSCALFGAVGGWLGMFCFRHKIRKPRFKFGIPLMLLVQIALLWTLKYFT